MGAELGEEFAIALDRPGDVDLEPGVHVDALQPLQEMPVIGRALRLAIGHDVKPGALLLIDGEAGGIALRLLQH